MASFKGIARNWLASVVEQQLDVTFQVIETNNGDALANELAKQAYKADIKVFSIEYQRNVIADPLDVFHVVAHWFGDTYGHDQVEQWIETHCYALQIDVIKTWYRGDYNYRKETLLYDEAGYEELEFLFSIEKLLNCFSQQKPFVVLMNNLDLAPDIVLTALNRSLDVRQHRSQWGSMGFVRHARQERGVESHNLWHECLRRLERQGLILPMPVEKIEPDEPSFIWYRSKKLKSFEAQYRMMLSAADMFAYRDVIRMTDQVRRKYNDQHNGQLLFISAFCSLMSGNLDSAVRDFTKVQNRLQATGNQAILTGSYFWLSICYTLKSQEKYARAAQEQCEKLALEYSDSRWYALSQFAGFYIDAHIAQHRITQISLESLRFLLTELNYLNLLSLLYTQVYSHTEHQDQLSSRTYLKNCVRALRFSRENRNVLGVSIALHAMGVVYMRIGNFKQTQRLYELSLSLREKYQQKADLVPMLNALGYFLIGQEEWHKAWSVFDRALGLLIEYRNFNEVSVTLYNYIWLYAQSGNTQRALDAMNDLLELMRIRNIDSVPFRNLKDLYVLKGWLHIQLRQPIQARYCLIRVKAYTELHVTSFTRILTLILNARVSFYEGEKTIAVRDNNKALDMIGQINDLDLYMESSLKMEVARLFVDLGRSNDAQPIFALLRKKAHEYGLNTLAQRVSRSSLGISSGTETSLPAIAQPYHVLLELAQKETQLAAMQHELAEIHQINLLVEMSNNEPEVEKFLKQTIGILDRRVPASEFGIIISSQEPSARQMDLMLSNDVDDAVLAQWRERLSSVPMKATEFEKNGDFYVAWPLLMSSADCSWLIVGGDEQQKTVWNEPFLNLLAQQLGLVLDRRLREAYLEHRNKTDLLTGALNRGGLFDRLKKQFKQMQRNPEQPFALCYFDLDHFKYFNDQFGHELGDRVLKNLVACVEGQLRGSDELGRVGGDEFIILLRKTDRQAAELLVERLRASIASTDWWLPLLVDVESNHERNPVPEEEWISASFGVVVMARWPKTGVSRIDLIAQGDKAMYEAKGNGKNCVYLTEYVNPHQDD